MKATELRIGNYINLNSQLPDSKYNYFVSSITQYTADLIILGADLQRANCTSYQLTDLSPIPLNEAWLDKLGFKDSRITLPGDGELEIRFPGNTVHIWPAGRQKESHNYKIMITYVHQLQNLYFALTGGELTSK
ncbi:hypothetical protein OQX61_23225 [Pedobacter sp. PLR]|uniref:hypothetical protein n=1 Tax=Pedobacter sp. PLR TaxID=2994465 RepID=UPI002247614B|nr:hypothetical protein [Pedobacter sp. PLR]MCX2454202.1 hypothetical protein [Pedobacter sp. PLR]